ncbi:MAG TPA: type II toxin-antitoxin system VapC family toxin [Candidatus Acidoferrales bacterium]|nr:type II toxin-antitoxin system VapC family toxin [Candidatus Acidoferrales bacterium]
MGKLGLILLDTHVAFWLLSEPRKLSPKAVSAIRNCRAQGDGVAIVDISLLEIAGLVRKKRIQTAISVSELLREFQARFVVRPITAEASAKTLELPPDYPKDPADRIIAATAIVEAMPLVTADRTILRCAILNAVW